MIEIIVDIGTFLLLINLILLIKGFYKNDKAYKIFTFYALVIFIIQVTANIFNHMSMHNLFLSHFYFILQFIILSFFYLTILKERFQKEIVKVGLSAGLIILGVQYTYDTSLYHKFNLFEIFITSFLLIIYSTFHFYNSLNENKSFYYINTGILIYLFGSTVLFLAGNLVATLSSKLNTITWTLNAFLYIIYQFFVFYDLRNYSKKTNTQPNED